jgi:NTE family protein
MEIEPPPALTTGKERAHMTAMRRSRVAIACQGGGSHTAFSAGVLQGLMESLPDDVEVVAISGTSGGAMCAALTWDGLARGDRQLAIQKLQDFWDDIAATEPWDKLLNESLLGLVRLRSQMILPEVSPYALPTWGEDRFREILNRHFDFEELRMLARRPGAPALHIGAVEVLSGHFEVFTGADLRVECLMASAAIPELFRAVTVPSRGVYWDGLFSQNPPIHDLTDHNINELWVIQINPSTCARVPVETHEIVDRRNELAGNISMEQELGIIEIINRLISRKSLIDPKYHPIQVLRIPFDRDLDYATKLDRWPSFLSELREYGITKSRWFLKERQGQMHTLEALGVLTPAGAV